MEPEPSINGESSSIAQRPFEMAVLHEMMQMKKPGNGRQTRAAREVATTTANAKWPLGHSR